MNQEQFEKEGGRLRFFHFVKVAQKFFADREIEMNDTIIGNLAITFEDIERLAYQKGRGEQEGVLRLISAMVEGDAGFESDCVLLDVHLKRDVSKREKILAELVSEIYRVVHPLFSTCKHPDWEKETAEKIKSLTSQNQ